MSVSLLRSLPPYGHREVLLVFAALATCDPGNVMDSLRAAKEQHIRVSVVGVAAEVYVCRRIAEETGGSYGVALNEAHLEQLMMGHSNPPPATSAQAKAELVRMGFPQRSTEEASSAVFVGLEARLLSGSYTCPRCKSRVPELPCECHICGLTLISSPHLARSYHHLFPVPPYHEDNQERAAEAAAALSGQPAMRDEVTTSTGLYCFGCLREVSQPGTAGQLHLTLRCGQCKQVFCFECDAYVHEQLHNCPGCEFGGT
ncbi:hypothetical protein PLESTF_000047400 [Pleodorina starrii]|nr:hypothetical protein PLESTF_000047400 [Pleodorina starrii]